MRQASPYGSSVLVTVAANAVSALVALATGTLVARLLGPAGRGELAAIQTWPTFIATIAMLGLPDALVYFSARDHKHAGRYLGSAVVLNLLASVPFLCAGYLAMPYLLAAQTPAVVAAARWYLLLIPLFTVVAMPLHPLRGLNDMSVWNALRLAPNFGWLGVLLFAAVAGTANPEWLAGGHLVMLVVLAAPVLWIVRKRIKGSLAPVREDWSPMLRYGIPSAAGAVPQVLNLRLDQMLMAAFLPPAALGLYVVAVSWSAAAAPLLSALGIVLFPRVASEGAVEARARILAKAARLSGLLAASLSVLLLAATPVAIPLLFGAEFRSAIPVALVLIAAGVVSSLNQILQEGTRGLGRPQLVLWSEFAGLAVAAAALTVLLPRFGIIGAAFASLLSYLAVTLLLAVQIRSVTGTQISELLVPTRNDVRTLFLQLKKFLGTRVARTGMS